MKKSNNFSLSFFYLWIDKEFFKSLCFIPVSHRNNLSYKKKERILSLFIALFFSIMLPFQGIGQTPSNEALWSANGWSLKKVVSNTTIASGVNFSYTIIFSAPAGVPNISIQDLVPVGLQVVSVTSAGPVCTVMPTTNIAGNTVTYNLTGLPGSCAPSGSFTIVVKFPEGTTCNGATARNRAEIMVNGKWEATPYVSTSATAVIPWKVSKTIIAKASVNPSGGTCGYIMQPDDTITYRLSVLKDSPYFGNVVGQQNLGTAVVTDNLPTGAVFISSTNPTCVSASGGIITWNVNCPTQILDAAIPWAYYSVDIKVKYPVGSFPVTTQILNQATLTGISCNQQYSHISNQTCIEVKNINPTQSGYFQKYISLTNRVPGCTGVYTIVFCNNGNVPLTAFNIDDAIPSGITVNQVGIWGANGTTTMNLNINGSPYATGINAYYNSPVLTSVSTLQFQMTTSLPVGACLYMYIYFTVNANPTGTIVTNCASFNGLANSLTLPQACVPFTVEAGTPKPCVYKDICSPKTSYVPGDIIRFRLRVQNIGSAAMTGASIQDVLNTGFTYVGNESYFVSNTFSTPCSVGSSIPSGATAWSGVTPSHSGSNLQWSLPSIASNCQLFYSAYCGYYGTYGIPYHYIEFDVKVDSLALPGITTNLFQISGGNLSGTSPSNTVNVLVTASFGQEVTKLFSTDNGATFLSSGTTTPGSTAKYRLNYKNTSNVPVSSIRLIDLLAKDAGTSDFLIFNRTINRGSQFSVSYIGNHATSLLPVSVAPTPVKTWAPGTNICLPPYVTTGGCTTTSWGGSPTSNIQMDYGTYSLVPGKNLREDFDIGIPLTAADTQQVCNDFAAIASANFLLNGSPQSVALTPVAAPPVCLTVGVKATCCDSVRVERVSGSNGVVGCCLRMATKCDVDSVKIDVFGGTIGSVTWNCGPLPSGYAGQNNFTFPANGCAVDMTACFNMPQAGVAIITYTIYFSNGEKCTKVMDLDCSATPANCCDSIEVRTVQNPTVPNSCCAEIISNCDVDSISVSVINGTLSSASWNCGPISAGYVGQSSYTFIANNCAADLVTCVNAKQTGSVTINYVVYLSNGEKCEKSVKLDCKAATCCDKTRLEKVFNSDGTTDCCVKLTTECEVKSVNVSVTNGTIASALWNCGPLPSGFIGQSNYTFVGNGCVLNMKNCFNATQSGVVTVTYTITFSNGETCKKTIELDCKHESSSCCALVDFKLKQKWPYFKQQVGTFTVTNLDPTSPICSVTIGASPSGTFTTAGLTVDGNPSSQSWNSTSIPTSGNLSPAAVNTMVFSLNGANYKGVITICIVKCDGTKCCFDFKWNSNAYIDVDVSIGDNHLPGKLVAMSINPVVNTDIDGKVKYVSFGMSDENEVNGSVAELFAISATEFHGEEYPEFTTAPMEAYMSKFNAFFVLAEPKSARENLGDFNLVFSRKMPKIGCTLFDEEGDIIFSGEIDIKDTLSTAVIQPGVVKSGMFEFINLYPNPSDGRFKVTYATGSQRDIEIRVVNPMGQVVKVIERNNETPGIHSVDVPASGITAGLYKVVLYSEGEVLSKSAVLKD